MRRTTGRVWLTLTCGPALVVGLAQPACARQDAPRGDGFALYRSGDYERAIRALESLVRSSPQDMRARRTLVAALMEVGRYEDAEKAARASDSPELANALGEVLFATGRTGDAEAAFQRSVQARASDALTARLHLALLQYDRGQRAAALEAFDGFIDVYNGAERLSAKDLIAVGTAVKYLGVRDPQLFKDAVKAYEEAIRTDQGAIDGRPAAVEARLRLGELFLDKYESTEAQTLFREVLSQNEHDPRALLDMAQAKNFDGSNESLEYVKKALDVNPRSVDARVLHARLLADLEDYDAARAEAEEALKTNPVSLDALSALATVEWLRGDRSAYEAVRKRAFAINPSYANFYNEIAELAARQRQYEGAAGLARQAIAIDSMSWWGWGVLGLNQLRNGDITGAKASLDRSFAGDPYNVWIKNTLDLLDTFDQYHTVKQGRFELMLREDEADLIGPYMLALGEEAFTKLAARYRYSPPTPIRVEVFPRHADFSVRTVGLAGFGALGVSFGSQLSMDSPSARDPGDFNWGSTFWHELTHAVTLGLSEHRVPRWLTEGLSVLEERRARTGWGDDLSLEFVAAYKQGETLPVSQLNEGFVRPKFPAQISFSYYEASLVAEMIEEQNGFDAILAMLRGYGDGKSEAQVFRDVLKTEPKQFDAKFDTWFRQRFAKQLASVGLMEAVEAGADERSLMQRLSAGAGQGELLQELREGRKLFEDGKYDEALPHFQKAKAVFPEYVGAANPYEYLGQIHEKKGEMREAAAELAALTAIDENAYAANVKLGALLDGLGDAAGAAAALDRAIWIYPYERELHDHLAALYARSGDKQGVVRARRALVALNPVDRAAAHYELAVALLDIGDRAGARTEVLRALEVAPSYPAAQELLLRLKSGGTRELPESGVAGGG